MVLGAFSMLRVVVILVLSVEVCSVREREVEVSGIGFLAEV